MHLGDWFTGWYVFALDARMPRDDACAGAGYSTNADLPVWGVCSAIVRSGPLGRIAGPRRPKLRILRYAELSRGRPLVASLTCVTTCHVYLEVMDYMVGIPANLTVTGTRTIGVNRGPLAHGPLIVNLHVDDSPLIEGRSRL